MISRKKIISRSQSDLEYATYEIDEDIWYNKDKLYQVRIRSSRIVLHDTRYFLREHFRYFAAGFRPLAGDNQSLCNRVFLSHVLHIDNDWRVKTRTHCWNSLAVDE